MTTSNLTRHSDALTVCAYCPSLCQHACPVATAEGSRSSTPWALMSLARHVESNSIRLDDELAERRTTGQRTPIRDVCDLIEIQRKQIGPVGNHADILR